MATNSQYVAFVGVCLIARGSLAKVATQTKARLDAGEQARLAIFDEESGRIIDIDYRGSRSEMLARLAMADKEQHTARHLSTTKRSGPGRPKLGVVSREISLLPRHWDWLAEQSGGASAALRRLVASARKNESSDAVARRAIEAAHRFLWDIAGDHPGFEDASRALFAMDFDRLAAETCAWPADIRDQLSRYVTRARLPQSGS